MSHNAIHQAMILAAGFGKRLQPLTLITPKPLISLKGKPLLQRTIERLLSSEINELVINTHYLAEQMHSFIETFNHQHRSCKIQISHEPDLLETGGAIAQALPLLTARPFFTVNSDIWWQEEKRDVANDIFRILEDKWDDQKMDALLVVVHQDNALFFEGPGDFHLQSDGQLQHRQDNTQNTSNAPFIYTGIQLIHPRLLQTRTGAFELPLCYREAAHQHRLYGIELQGKWSDVGTLTALAGLETYLST